MSAQPDTRAPLPRTLLSKHQFIKGRDCPAKLWYAARDYPNTNEENDFLTYLAESGHLVGEIARMAYPEGHRVASLDPDEAEHETQRLLAQDRVVIFEAMLRAGPLFARIDILIKDGRDCRLIEVKSKKAPPSFLTNAGDRVRADWVPYVEDLAYQTHLAQAAMPGLCITPWLMLTDGDARCQTANLHSLFEVRREGRRCEVSFHGNASERQELVGLLSLHDMSTEVALVLPEVAAAAAPLAALVAPEAPHPRPELSARCRKCEFRVGHGVEPNGFRECWGALAVPAPHIFDLHHGDLLKGGGSRVLNQMIRGGRTSMFDVRDDEWAVTDKPYRQRQAMQIENTRLDREWIDPALAEVMRAARYPLQFVDFEFDQSAVPHVPGTGPWSRIAFQWSLHRIPAPGAPVEHLEFLDTASPDPHPGFLRGLRDALDLRGTVLVWSSAEAATLRNLITGRDQPGIQEWIDQLVAEDGPILDMEKLTLRFHFHPAMKGQTSIKKVFPPAWRACRAVDTLPACAEFLEYSADGQRRDPYALLAERNPDFPVADGTGAILAYHALKSGRLPCNKTATLRQQLLTYCRLDTLAMLVIWLRWDEALSPANTDHGTSR